MSTRLELADAPALARATRRTRATRLVLALALAGLVGAAALTAAKGGTAPAKAAVTRKNVEIVVDEESCAGRHRVCSRADVTPRETRARYLGAGR